MGLFSSSKSSTVNESNTLNQAFNQQTGASEGSVAFGAGATGNSITTSDPATVKAASDAILRATTEAVAGNVEVSRGATKDALDFGSDALATNRAVTSDALSTVSRTIGQANEILARSGETYAAKLANNAGVAPQTLVQDSQKSMVQIALIGGLALVGLGFFVFASKR